MTKQPATLQLQATKKLVTENDWHNVLHCCPWLPRILDMTQIQDIVFEQRFVWFDFEIVTHLRCYTNFDDNQRENVCEEANTWDALLESEGEKIYFFFLNKIAKQGFYGLNIPITIHWYEYLYNSGFFLKLFKCNNSADLENMLLMLAGDVESNPGPTYKDVCKLDYIKSKHERKIYKDKSMRRMNLNLKPKRNDDFDYLRDQEYVKGEMQIFGLTSTIGQIAGGAYMANRSRTFMNTMEAKVDMISAELSNTLQMFRNTFKDVENSIYKGIDLISLIGDIIFGLIQVSLAQAGKKLYSLGIEIFRILTRHGLSTDLLDSIKTFTNEQFCKIRGKMQIEAPASTLELMSPTHLCLFLFGILSLIFTGVCPKTTQVEMLIKRLGDISRSTKNIIDFNNATHTGMTTVLNEIKKTLGIRPSEEIENFIEGINRWFDEVRSLLQRSGEWRKSDQVLKDPAVIMEVENLYKRGMEYSREITDKKLQRDLTMPFQMHMKYLTELMKQVDTSGAFGTKPRTQPVVIWLFGESGVGKSGMSWPLAIDLNNIFVHNSSEAKEFSKNIYMRNVEQEFWDNYQGQNVVIYDDFGQRVDSQQAPNEEFMELIRTANIAPYPLHMAHLEDKRKTRFTSKILLMTSNVFEQNVSSLTFPDAFRRRIDLCGKVTNVMEFTKEGYSTKDAKTVRRLDKKKVQEHFGEVVSTEVYNIDLIDPESGATLRSNLTYEEFVELAADKTREAFDSSTKMNEFLERYAVNRFKNMHDSEYRDKGSVQIDNIQEEDLINQLCLSEEELNLDALISLAEEKMLVDKQGTPITVDNITTDKFDEYWSLNLMGKMKNQSFEEWLPTNLKETVFKKFNSIGAKLKLVKDSIQTKLVQWKNSTIEWIKSHPFTILSTILGTLITIMTVCSFWNRFFSKPKESDKIAEYTHQNVTIKLYRNQKGFDVREFSQAGIMSLIPKILTDVTFNATKALIMNKPFPLVINLLSTIGFHVTIYSVNKLINIRGRKLELSEPDVCMLRPQPEAKASGDPTTIAKQKVVVEARVSGDPTTMTKQKIVIEAKSSADPTTVKQKQPVAENQHWAVSALQTLVRPYTVPEAKASADPTTLNRKHVVMEASSSGDPTTMKQRSHMMEGSEGLAKVPADMQMWKDQTAQNLISNRIFSNLYKICKVLDKANSTPLLHGLFVKGTCMLVPAHLCEFLNDGDRIEIVNSFNTSFEIPWKEVRQIHITDFKGDEKEAKILMFPNYIPQHADLVKHFSNATAMAQYKRADVCLPLLRYSEKMKRLLMYILGNTQAVASDKVIIIEDAEKGKDYTIREGLYYNAPTKNGDCGAPVIVNETQVLRKIAGIHVAGNFTGTAYAESITQKDLERAFEKISAQMQIKLDLDTVCKFHAIDMPFDTEIDPLTLNMTPGPKFNAVGKIEPIYEAGKTELRRSLVFGKIAEIYTKPAKLRNYIEDGKFINIKHKNLSKAAMDTPFLDPDLLTDATLLVKQKWLQNMRPELRRVLTYEEAIKGNDVSEYISPINRQSSPGFPWVLKRTKGAPGKTGWFGNTEEYILNEEVEQAVNFRISQAKLGIRVPTMWVDTLKDERRPIAKVDAGKTRVFSNGPMDYSIAFRQYFLGFVAHLMENRITNEVSIGTNVYSRDWTKTAKKMQEKGKKVFAGDFSQFDGTLNSSMMFKFLQVVNEFYDDGEENALIRYTLFSEIVNSVHICDDIIYYMTHSQPSGNPVTTPLNCFINSVGGRMCFEIASRNAGKNYSMFDFDRHVSLVSYGDDNIYNVTDEVSSWFNMNTITAAFWEIGMIYTDETKDLTKVPPPYKTLEEVSYLKRGFVKTNTGRWLAPLDINTITEMPNWCRGGLDIEEGTKVNCENAIMELAMHPVEVYDKWTGVIAKAFTEATGNQLEYKSYRGYNQGWLEEYFL